MRALLAIPSNLKRGVEADVAGDRHPTMDYFALESELLKRGATVELVGYGELPSKVPRDVALAHYAFRNRGRFDAIFTNGENVGLPLAMLFKSATKRPRHVTIGHRLSPAKKKPFFTVMKAHRQIDKIFLYATTQRDYARDQLGIPDAQLSLIPFHADADFYRPMPTVAATPGLVSSAGLEWRDYDTLIKAAQETPGLTYRLAAASPWSKHANATENRELPANVAARRYEYGELRDLYAASEIVVVPLIDNDFQAGVTTILEGMAMGKPVIATRTKGQTDVIVNGENGLYIPPGNPVALRDTLNALIADPERRVQLGSNGRAWIESNATLTRWASTIVDGILG